MSQAWLTRTPQLRAAKRVRVQRPCPIQKEVNQLGIHTIQKGNREFLELEGTEGMIYTMS
jgi:hypothetical protein